VIVIFDIAYRIKKDRRIPPIGTILAFLVHHRILGDLLFLPSSQQAIVNSQLTSVVGSIGLSAGPKGHFVEADPPSRLRRDKLADSLSSEVEPRVGFSTNLSAIFLAENL
jgi:hypothetical protein